MPPEYAQAVVCIDATPVDSGTDEATEGRAIAEIELEKKIKRFSTGMTLTNRESGWRLTYLQSTSHDSFFQLET